MYYNEEQKLLINTTLILAFILTVVAFIIASILVFLICSHEIGAVESNENFLKSLERPKI